MGGSRARASTRARDNGVSQQDTQQEQLSDHSSAAVEADQAAAAQVGAAVSPAALRGMSHMVRRKALTGLSAAERAALVQPLANDTDVLDDLFRATPDNEPETLRRIIELRFHKQLNNQDKTVWDAGGLRRLYTTLAALPASHVAGNASFDVLTKYGDSDKRYIHGYYAQTGGKDDTIALSYDPNQLDWGVHGEYVEKTDGLIGVNEFDSCVRHEVGHAVDAKLGVMDQHQGEAAFGGWRQYSNIRDWAGEMWDATPHANANKGHREVVLDVLADAIDLDPSTNANGAVDPDAVSNRFVKAVRSRLHTHKTLKDADAEAASPIVAHIGRVLTGAKPWNGHDGGGAINGRVYEESYKGQYMSYDAAARDPAKRCSLYQFRAPGEFFAESYSLYYTPVKGGEMRGKLLADRNKPLFDWFVKNFETPKGQKPA